MTNAELIAELRGHIREVPLTLVRAAADALEAAEKRIDGLQKLVDINTERCEALRKQLRESHEGYEKCLNELEAKLPKHGEREAKKPKIVKETEYSFYCDCPTCGGRLISNVDGEWCAGSFDRFCRMCGQKIDWSEYCGWSNRSEDENSDGLSHFGGGEDRCIDHTR